MNTAYWTVEVLRASDPARVALGITTTDSFARRPVALEVPGCVLAPGPAQVAYYFRAQRRSRYELRQAFALPPSISFCEG
ncbi:hypothetical protein [Hymenobacter crusticola]|uniref:hypothetical protein n=1 Tax=Hymenobacter crusticola TaxID=1770526 RepID=UPI00117A197D|nr:hypothetical protein [Hymenobacter crusticola]